MGQWWMREEIGERDTKDIVKRKRHVKKKTGESERGDGREERT